MSNASNIEWTDATWNPVVGCSRVSAGCDRCYAVGMTRRLEGMSKARHNARLAFYAGLTVESKPAALAKGQMVRVPEDKAKMLDENGIKVCCQGCVGKSATRGGGE